MSTLLTNKKGQLKIQQMIFMLLAVTLFFILVGLFFIAYKTTTLQKEVATLKKDKADGLVGRIAGNPEFTFEGKSNAIDADKLMILQTENKYVFVENGRKKTFWGVEGIIVRKIYPLGEDIECTRDNYPDCNLIKLFTKENSAPSSSFVSWCTKKNFQGTNYDKCELAEIMIKESELK